jgi:hypothetical protein
MCVARACVCVCVRKRDQGGGCVACVCVCSRVCAGVMTEEHVLVACVELCLVVIRTRM